MKISSFEKYICPMDELPLLQRGGSLKCEKNHSFDINKDGYCNLLLVQQKNSKDPGDNKEMVAARKRFLEQKFYQPLLTKLVQPILEFTQIHSRLRQLSIVDAGCGEGYYLHNIAEELAQVPSEMQINLAGFDISKWAIQAAAKRNRDIAWCVASNKNPPYAKSSIHIILSLFGFPNGETFSRIQSKDGIILLCDSGENHLLELRKIIYDEVKITAPPSIEIALANGYREIKNERVQFAISAPNQVTIQDLLAMTPHAYRAKEDGLARMREYSSLETQGDIRLRVLKLEK